MASHTKSKNLVFWSIFSILFIVLLSFLLTTPVVRINADTLLLLIEEIDERAINNWANSVKNSQLVSLKNKNISKENDPIKILEAYENSYKEHNQSSFIDIFVLGIENEEIETVEKYKEIEFEDENFFEGEKYVLNNGVNGKYKHSNLTIFLLGEKYNLEKVFLKVERPLTEKKIGVGQRELGEVEMGLKDEWKSFTSLILGVNEGFSQYVELEEEEYEELYKIENLETKLNDSIVKNLTVEVEDDPEKDLIQVGEMKLENTRCNDTKPIQIIYKKSTSNFLFSNIVVALEELCNEPISNGHYIPDAEVEIHSCSDCSLAPVDKAYALPASYTPSLVTTDLKGGGQLNSKTKEALQEFFAQARKDGFELAVVSAYRSYDQQIYTFNFWVNRELATGLTRIEAEERANIYSAKPGHSEHQLGTTVDLRSTKCPAFHKSCNRAGYDYIEANAHKYGFIISYPENMQELTGYKHEPWHVRFIGKIWAQELYDRGYLSGSGDYLSKFLIEKGNY